MTHRDDGSDDPAGPPADSPATVGASSGQATATPTVPDIHQTIEVLTQLAPLLRHLHEKMTEGDHVNS